MNFERFRRDIKQNVFDYQLLAKYFSDLRKPRDKVSSLMAEGKIIPLKKGLYVFGEEWRHAPLQLELIANLIYGPSCVSFEYALFFYGLLSERPSVITSLTLGDSKIFNTPIGSFEYRVIDKEKFKVGVEYKNVGENEGYFIASKEKALVDLVYKTPGIRTKRQLYYYLFEEMRIDEEQFRTLDFKKLEELAAVYKKKSVLMIGRL